MIDPEKKTGAFAPIAKQIAEDADKLTDKDDNWTAYARKLDQMSLKAYLEQFRGKTDDWAIDLLDVAYNIEFGLVTEDQSSLAMVDFITTDMSKPFSMFGESDEVYRIKGGSSALINALVDALKDKIEMKQGCALTALDYKGGQIVMGFDAPGGPQTQSFDAVILALPFTKLRQVKGLEQLAARGGEAEMHSRTGLWAECQDHVRHHIARRGEAPTRACPRRRTAPSIPISASRTFGSTSRAQPGDAGILTNYLGVKPGINDAKSALDVVPCRSAEDVAEDGRQSRSHRRSSPGSGASIPSRSAATPAPKWDNTRRCWKWRRSLRSTAACNLPASIPAATFSAS